MVSIVASFVQRTYLCRYYCDNVYRKITNLDFEEAERTWTFRRHVQTVAIMVCVLVPASFIHGFRDVGNFAGIFSCFMTFGLPGLCLIAKFKQSREGGQIVSSGTSYEEIGSNSENHKNGNCSRNKMVTLSLGIAILSAFIFVVICGILSAIYMIFLT